MPTNHPPPSRQVNSLRGRLSYCGNQGRWRRSYRDLWRPGWSYHPPPELPSWRGIHPVGRSSCLVTRIGMGHHQSPLALTLRLTGRKFIGSTRWSLLYIGDMFTVRHSLGNRSGSSAVWKMFFHQFLQKDWWNAIGAQGVFFKTFQNPPYVTTGNLCILYLICQNITLPVSIR